MIASATQAGFDSHGIRVNPLADSWLQVRQDPLRSRLFAHGVPYIAVQNTCCYAAAPESTRQQALAAMATDSQAGLARWIEDATSLASGKAA